MSARKQKIEMQNVVASIAKELSEKEKEKVLRWAEKSLVVIKNNSISKVEKIKQLNRLDTPKSALVFLQVFFRFVKNKTWTNHSWARRLGFISVTVGAAVFGTQGAGLVAMGGGVGISLALLSTVGATFIGVVIDEFSKEIKK